MARDSKAAERKTGVAAWNESEGTARDRVTGARARKSEADRRRRVGLLVALLVVCVACVACMWPIKERITRGLWLKGGTAYTMHATTEEGEVPTHDALSSAAGTILLRLQRLEVADATARPSGDDAILVELPWFVEGDALAQAVGGAGLIEFVRVDEIGDADALAKINAGTANVALKDGTYTPFMDGSAISSASVTEVASGVYAITFEFTEEGSQTFADVTRELAEDGGSIAIVVDGRVMSAPSVSEEITGGQVSISGDFDANEANAIKAVVDTGTLPLKLTSQGSEKVGPLVGKRGLWAMVCGALAALVLATLVALRRFGKLAVLVCGSLVVYGVTLLGTLALLSRADFFVLTMPGVLAGCVTAAVTLYAVWRLCALFCEKASTGSSIKGASISAVRDGLRPLAGPCAAVIVVGMAFQLVPASMARDFGIVAVAGGVCGLVAATWYAVTMLRLLAGGAIQAAPASWGIHRPEGADATDVTGNESI